jgi:trk system potassium uptake protein TrkA
MRIIIAGAGRGGLSLGIHLQGLGHAVTILDRDAVIAQRAQNEHGLVALSGDATDATLLRQADPARADVVLAMLHRDADNLAVAMLASSLGAARVMVRMRDPDYRHLYEKAGIDQILSETELLVGALATAVEHAQVRHSMVLGSGEAVAVELAIPDGAKVIGRSVSEVAAEDRFPRSCVVAGMSLEMKVDAPRGNSVFAPGMRILLGVAREELSRASEIFLEGGRLSRRVQ